MDSKPQASLSALARRNLVRVSHQRHQVFDAAQRLKAGEFYYLSDLFDLSQQIADKATAFSLTDVARTAFDLNAFILELEPDEMHTRFDELDSLVAAIDTAVSTARTQAPGPRSRRRGDRLHSERLLR